MVHKPAGFSLRLVHQIYDKRKRYKSKRTNVFRCAQLTNRICFSLVASDILIYLHPFLLRRSSIASEFIDKHSNGILHHPRFFIHEQLFPPKSIWLFHLYHFLSPLINILVGRECYRSRKPLLNGFVGEILYHYNTLFMFSRIFSHFWWVFLKIFLNMFFVK